MKSFRSVDFLIKLLLMQFTVASKFGLFKKFTIGCTKRMLVRIHFPTRQSNLFTIPADDNKHFVYHPVNRCIKPIMYIRTINQITHLPCPSLHGIQTGISVAFLLTLLLLGLNRTTSTHLFGPNSSNSPRPTMPVLPIIFNGIRTDL